jgi:hypothetical protein
MSKSAQIKQTAKSGIHFDEAFSIATPNSERKPMSFSFRSSMKNFPQSFGEIMLNWWRVAMSSSASH